VGSVLKSAGFVCICANPLGFLSEIVAKIPLCSDELLEKSLKNFEKKGSRRELIFHGLL
jgi:hypothetical protein